MIPQEETLAEAVDRFTRSGFTEQFRAAHGKLEATASGRRFRPEDLRVVKLLRFEGVSDPDDSAIVMALASDDGVRGTYCVPYSHRTPGADAQMLRRLGARDERADLS